MQHNFEIFLSILFISAVANFKGRNHKHDLGGFVFKFCEVLNLVAFGISFPAKVNKFRKIFFQSSSNL